MAIEMNARTKILAGVVALAAAGAAAWFLFLEEFLQEPPPKPVPVAAKGAQKEAAKEAAKDAPKGDAPKAVEVAKADAPKSAEPAKGDAPKAEPAKAASAPKPGAKPIPTNPDQLIAEVIDASGLRAYFQTFGREAMLSAGAGNQAQASGMTPAEFRAVVEIVERVFEPRTMTAELAANLKGSFDAERMSRFLELLRQPIAVKMTSAELRNVSPEAMREYGENFRKSPPPAARTKLIQTLDEVTRTSEVGADMASAMARDMIDAMLASMQKAGKQVPREARQQVGSQLNAMRNQSRSQIRTMMYVMYRNVSDEELAEYVKLLDTDTGRWGMETLANATKPVMTSRGSSLGKEVAQFVMGRQAARTRMAKVEEPRPEEKLATAAPAVAKPAQEPVYQRPANMREAYTRYNDLVTATVMRDRAAVKELLDAGKFPNVRQSDGLTPLMIAASNGDLEIASMLLAKGADPNLRSPGGNSAMRLAKARNNAEMLRVLERGGGRI